jgi:hypothetical protein
MIQTSTIGGQHHEAVDATIDLPRLKSQYARIMDHLKDYEWHTLFEIAAATDTPHGSVGSQIRNARVDGHTVSRRRATPKGGTWEYRLERPAPRIAEQLLLVNGQC